MRSTLASRQQDKRLAAASDKAPSRPVSLFNDQNMPKVVLGGTVGDKLFKRAWDHYDPTNTGEVRLSFTVTVASTKFIRSNYEILSPSSATSNR
jgi:hypothetical protein